MGLFNSKEKITRKDFIKKLGAGALGVLAIGKGLEEQAKAAVTFSDNVAGNIYVSAVAPVSTDGLWIDLSSGGISKYHNGVDWIPVAGGVHRGDSTPQSTSMLWIKSNGTAWYHNGTTWVTQKAVWG